jgi:hypothetical protein
VTGDDTVAIDGQVGATQLLGIQAAGVPSVYTLADTDTPAIAAAGLAALIPGASVSGVTITVPGSNLVARVGGYVGLLRRLTANGGNSS